MPDKILFPKEEIIDGKYFNTHQDWEVPIPGFFILAPKRAIRSVMEMTDEEAAEFINLMRKTRRGMMEELGIKDVYFFMNEDTSDNLHLWIFPRLPWMEAFGRKIESVRPIINHAKTNMVNESVFTEVKAYVKRMRKYMA